MDWESWVFFFQAEDGIRDYDVTGVQTCALPICKLFWGVVCSRGAYNVIYSLFLTDEIGGDVKALQVPYADGERTAELMNIDFDAETQTLTNFDKGRGLGDCGALTSWVWTGKAFALAHPTPTGRASCRARV